MKLRLTPSERRFGSDQICTMAIQASQVGDRELYRELMRLANQFSDSSVVTNLKNHQAKLVLDLASNTISTIESDILPKLEKIDRKNKEEAISRAKEMLETNASLVHKLKEAMSDKN